MSELLEELVTAADVVLPALTWKTETRKVSELEDHAKNPRKITKEQMEKLKESLKKFNYVETVVIDTNNRILAGHMRVRALKALRRGNSDLLLQVK